MQGSTYGVWNRTLAKAAAVGVDARRTSTPGDAAAGADVLITMLADGAAVEQVMTGPTGALSMLPAGAIWIQMSTVGAEWTDRFAGLVARHDVAFVDAPVSGSSGAAAKGELVILASGATAVRPRVEPIFDVLGHQTLWLQSAGDGSRLKLALNNWLAVLVEGMVETLTLSEALGLDPTSCSRLLGTGRWVGLRTGKGRGDAQRRIRPRLPVATRDQGRGARTERRPPARCGASADERSTTALVRGHRRRPWRR